MSKFLVPFAASLVLFFGCAHPIVITPDLSRISRDQVKPIDVNVGYYISPADLTREVETPGGGGDKVKYSPYKELEPALFKALSNVFRRAYSMPSANDTATIKTNDIAFVFVPQIETESSSDSLLTWPPTSFKVKLSCKALDATGKVIWEKQIVGEGKATFSEFKADFSLAAKRASEQAISDFQREVGNAPELRK
jgi:hypothetical protein